MHSTAVAGFLNQHAAPLELLIVRAVSAGSPPPRGHNVVGDDIGHLPEPEDGHLVEHQPLSGIPSFMMTSKAKSGPK